VYDAPAAGSYVSAGPNGDPRSKPLVVAGKSIAVPQNKCTTLNLQDTRVGDGEGLAAMAAMLQKNVSLTSVDLQRNQIGDRGAQYLVRAEREREREGARASEREGERARARARERGSDEPPP
jgi:hypothetical protein